MLRSLAIFTLILAGCTRKQVSEVQPPPPPPIKNLPVEFTIAQRTEHTVAGIEGDLAVFIDDITAGQVVVTLKDTEENIVFGPVSMQEKVAQDFRFKDFPLQIVLTKLDNALIGEDFATFRIQAQPQGLTESEKIEGLIESLKKLPEGTQFIRNGKKNSVQEAVELLLKKRKATKGKITQANEFLEKVASKSSVSGKPYSIQYPDGQTENAEVYLRQQLEVLEKVTE